MTKEKCSDCKYIEPISGDVTICKFEGSSYYNQDVSSNESCRHFLNNPAQDYFSKGLKALSGTNEKGKKEGINLLKKALNLGLPSRDEIICLVFIADFYISEDAVDRGLESLERALKTDALNAKNFGKKYVSPFMENVPLRFMVFYKPQALYALKSKEIKESDGTEPAISYLKEKLSLVNHLDKSHMSLLYFELGMLYAKKGEKNLAFVSFKKSTEADIDYPATVKKTEEYEIFKDTHDKAWHNLRILAENPTFLSDLKHQKKDIQKDIQYVRQTVVTKFKEAGILMYPQLINDELRIPDKEVGESVNQIKAVDIVIDNYTNQVNDLESQQLPSGFMSRLKVKASSTLKTRKIQLDLRDLKKKKEEAFSVLGEKLYDCYTKGTATLTKLQEIWEAIDVLKEKIKSSETEDASLEKVLQELQRY